MIYIYCDNKGCGQHQAPKLNIETDEVICSDCDKPIKQVTPQMKIQLKHFHQTLRKEKRQKAFSVKCEKCEKEGQPVLKVEKNKSGAEINLLLCPYCKTEITGLSAPFKQAILEFLRTAYTE